MSIVSKSPAKKAPPRKVAGKSAPGKAKAAPKARVAAKPAAKAKPSARPLAKAGKPAVKPAAKTPAKGKPAKPIAKPAARPPAQSPHQAHPSRKVSHPPARAASPASLAPKTALPKPAVAQAARPATAPLAPSPLPKTTDKPQVSPVPSASSRFTERFAPPRPPQRVLPEPVEPVRPTYKADPRLANAWKTKAGRDLSEDELLAMPDGEYMNEKQLEFFRTRLQALKDDLLSNAGETTEHLREDTSIVPDPADRATIEEEHALELRTRDRERKLLKKISQSLARIEAGDYGYCDETGEPIGLGRLLARPTATLSLEAQQRRELKQKMFGD
ncbi:MAG: RNA polymerase-binding transcription factor DksA [Burkholderiaceae bacterium]|nr:RNA polymerase-binding transcription factor DksA [Burkholderiaceae bacterium]